MHLLMYCHTHTHTHTHKQNIKERHADDTVINLQQPRVLRAGRGDDVANQDVAERHQDNAELQDDDYREKANQNVFLDSVDQDKEEEHQNDGDFLNDDKYRYYNNPDDKVVDKNNKDMYAGNGDDSEDEYEDQDKKEQDYKDEDQDRKEENYGKQDGRGNDEDHQDNNKEGIENKPGQEDGEELDMMKRKHNSQENKDIPPKKLAAEVAKIKKNESQLSQPDGGKGFDAEGQEDGTDPQLKTGGVVNGECGGQD